MNTEYLIIYIVGVVVTAFFFDGKNAKGEDDPHAHVAFSLLWFVFAFFFIMFSPALIPLFIRWVKKKIYE